MSGQEAMFDMGNRSCDVSSQLVEKVYSAYRRGRWKAKDTSIERGLQRFLESVETFVRPRVSRREQMFCVLCKRSCEQAREAVNRNAIEAACQHLAGALSIAGSPALGEEARLRCQAEIVPVEAYLDLWCGDHEAARTRYLKSLKLDQEIEDRFGPRLIHAHRIHVAIRLATVDGLASDGMAASEAAVALFKYLAGKTQRLSLPGDWGPEARGVLSAEMIQFLSLQLTYELAGVMAQAPAHIAQGIATHILSSDAFQDEKSCHLWNGSTRRWFELKALSNGDTLSFLQNCSRFLADGPKQSLALWLAAALDAVAASDLLSAKAAAPFKQDVVNDLRALKYLPIGLQRALLQMQASLDARRRRPLPGRVQDAKGFVTHQQPTTPRLANTVRKDKEPMAHMNEQELSTATREVLKRAVIDPNFRQLALRDSKAAFAKVSDKSVPTGFNFQFIENYGKSTKTIVIPDPVAHPEQLTEEELEQVAGGVLSDCTASNCGTTGIVA